MARAARDITQQAEAKRRGVAGRLREATTQSNQAERRRQTAEGNSLSPAEKAYWQGLLREVRRGHGDDKPHRLTDWVIAQGGIMDPETMLPPSMTRRPGLVNRRTGRDSGRPGVPLDNLREMAIEDGYYLPDGEDALNGGNLNDFVDMLMRDINGDAVYAVYRPEVADAVAHMEYLNGLREAMSSDGIDFRSASVDEFASWYSGQDFKTLTPFQRGRANEARLREEQSGRRLRAAQDRADDIEVDVEDARAAARTYRELMPEQTEIANEARRAQRLAQRDRDRLQRDIYQAERRANLSDEDLRADAERTVDRILSNPAGRINNEGAGRQKNFRAGFQAEYSSALSGRFKARSLDIPDVEIEDFLISDLPDLQRGLVRSMAPDMEMIKRFGSVDMELELNRVGEDFLAEINAADTPAKRAQLEAQRSDALRDLMGVRDRLRGVYAMPDNPNSLSERLASNLVHLNYLRLMGGVTLSSLPDAPRALFTYGLGRSGKLAFDALTNNLSSIKGMDAELQAAGSGFEMILNTRVMEMTDLVNERGAYSAMERFTNAATSHFGYASLIAPWNRAMKAIAGYGVQNRLLRAAMNVADGKPSLGDADYLARLGFNEDQARQMAEQFRRVGQEENGNLVARSDLWGNENLRQMWLSAIRKEVDDLIVTPGQNKPLLASTTWGRVLMQFRSYNMSATQKVMMRYAQGVITAREAHIYMMLGTQIALGGIVAWYKAEQNGLSTAEWGTEKWMLEAVDRSGLLGALSDINLAAEYATGGRAGLSALTDDGRMSRYASRNAVGQFLGPSAGLGADAFTATGMLGDLVAKAAGDEDVTIYQSDIRAARRILPLQNMWFLRDLFDRIEHGTGDAVGATGQSVIDRREAAEREREGL